MTTCLKKSTIACMHLLILTTFAMFNATDSCLINMGFEVHILNYIGFGPPLTVHCLSGDNDIGTQVIPYNGDYNFKFCENIALTTLYHCSVSWASKSLSFDAFNRGISNKCSQKGLCHWEARPDGIYFLHVAQNFLELIHPW